MPEAAEFLEGFGLVSGKQLAGYVLTHATSTHESIKRYQEYRYKITLTFQNRGTGVYENLYYALHAYISLEHIIYGIKNPYRCIIDDPQEGDVDMYSNGAVVFNLTGHAYRS